MANYSTPKSRWTALVNRDRLAADAFVYCVTTTKIYCRPNCPSRLARRANIEFHDTAAEARAAGYRACMRCRPDMSEEEGDPQRIAISKTCASIQQEARAGRKKGLKQLASEAGFTESHFCRIFKKGTGMTVGEYRASIASRQSSISNMPTSEPEQQDKSRQELPQLAETYSQVQAEQREETESQALSASPYDFDFNTPPFLDQGQLDFEVESGWFDFSRAPNAYDSFDMVAELPDGSLFDDGYSNTDAEFSVDTILHLWPKTTKTGHDLQFQNPEQYSMHVI